MDCPWPSGSRHCTISRPWPRTGYGGPDVTGRFGAVAQTGIYRYYSREGPPETGREGESLSMASHERGNLPRMTLNRENLPSMALTVEGGRAITPHAALPSLESSQTKYTIGYFSIPCKFLVI